MNNWECLCDRLELLLDEKDVSESLFQKTFVKALREIFNWDESRIKQQVSVRMGSTDKFADIVLTGDDFNIVIEMKKPDKKPITGDIKQLVSYLHDLEDNKYRYGFLIGNSVTVVYYDKASGNKPEEVVSFFFDSDNKDGTALGEILDISVCSDEKLKEYVSRIMRQKQEEKEAEIERGKAEKLQAALKSELLENNGEMIKDMLKEWLLSDEYTEEIIDEVLDDIEIGPKGMVGTDGGGTTSENIITNFSERCIIIKIKPQSVMTKNGPASEKLYEAVRRCWKNKLSTVQRADYVLAVIEGKVWGVYKPTRWYKVEQPECMNCPVGEDDGPCGRIAFDGEKASEDVQEKYLYKLIPAKYRKQGMAAPVLFPKNSNAVRD